MKETIKIDHVRVTCDVCGKNDPGDLYYECVGCGKDFCWDCHKISGLITHESTNYSNEGFFFCNGCIIHMPEEIKPLYYASLRVEGLIRVRDDLYYEHKKTESEANAELQRLRDQRKKVK